MQALRIRGMDLVAGVLHEPSACLHRPAARWVASLARPGHTFEVADAVAKACGYGSGALALLLTRALGGLSDAASAAAARWEGAAEGVALAEGLDALASLCGAGRPPPGDGSSDSSAWGDACGAVCGAPGDGLRRLVGVVQGRDAALDALEPSRAAAVKAAAARRRTGPRRSVVPRWPKQAPWTWWWAPCSSSPPTPRACSTSSKLHPPTTMGTTTIMEGTAAPATHHDQIDAFAAVDFSNPRAAPPPPWTGRAWTAAAAAPYMRPTPYMFCVEQATATAAALRQHGSSTSSWAWTPAWMPKSRQKPWLLSPSTSSTALCPSLRPCLVLFAGGGFGVISRLVSWLSAKQHRDTFFSPVFGLLKCFYL